MALSRLFSLLSLLTLLCGTNVLQSYWQKLIINSIIKIVSFYSIFKLRLPNFSSVLICESFSILTHPLRLCQAFFKTFFRNLLISFQRFVRRIISFESAYELLPSYLFATACLVYHIRNSLVKHFSKLFLRIFKFLF